TCTYIEPDQDGDGWGDGCDPCPVDATDDSDGDGLCDSEDLCPQVADQSDVDTDADGIPDDCDEDSCGAGRVRIAGQGCAPIDQDGDGVGQDVDCDDDNAAVGDCSALPGTPYCDPEAGRCVGCTRDEHCEDSQLCEVAAGSCVACLSDTDCEEGLVCDVEAGSCLECLTDTDCGATQVCDGDTASCVECLVDTDCGEGLHCATESARCVLCQEDAECDQAPLSYCDPAADGGVGACVACLEDDHCDNGACAPHCDEATWTCVLDPGTQPAPFGDTLTQSYCQGICEELQTWCDETPATCVSDCIADIDEDGLRAADHYCRYKAAKQGVCELPEGLCVGDEDGCAIPTSEACAQLCADPQLQTCIEDMSPEVMASLSFPYDVTLLSADLCIAACSGIVHLDPWAVSEAVCRRDLLLATDCHTSAFDEALCKDARPCDEDSPTCATWDKARGGNGHVYQAVALKTGITWWDAQMLAELLGGHL
ncbi:MAG: hypothetical protein QF464_17985, partial [Myxococcota bacterium]|nr:hypothetical protein [Myxococcota bacterium]